MKCEIGWCTNLQLPDKPRCKKHQTRRQECTQNHNRCHCWQQPHPGDLINCRMCNTVFPRKNNGKLCPTCLNTYTKKERDGLRKIGRVPRTSIPCNICGDPFTPTNPTKACTTCRTTYTKEQRRNMTATPRPCAICGKPYRNAKKKRTTCGSNQCAQTLATRNLKITKQCVTCGTTFTGYPAAKYCTDQCQPQQQPWQPQPRNCTQCGETFTPTNPANKYCTLKCRDQATINRAGGQVKDLYRGSIKLKMNGAGWLRTVMRHLADRDGTTCQICGTKIRMHYKSGPNGTPSGLGPSIDHIIPRTERPDLADEPANWRLTHWKCNRTRKTRTTGTEQLAIIG